MGQIEDLFTLLCRYNNILHHRKRDKSKYTFIWDALWFTVTTMVAGNSNISPVTTMEKPYLFS
ncbi:MAG: hypothetical protein NKF70_12045 [Methanobacterium sp. ERen5]|nr:MAG: hypothetical protein NKF70_12045 [Methanobacterium sp. ERen5]